MFDRSERACEECGQGFMPKDQRSRFCSTPCRSRWKERLRPTRPFRRHRRTCAACSARFVGSSEARYCSAECRRFKDSPSSPLPWSECAWCGHWFLRRWARKYCSQTCLEANHPRRSRITAICYGDCRRCGRTFVRRADKLGDFCSEICAKRQRKSDRKHLQRTGLGGERFTLREIAERDGWRCHICHRKVPDREYKARDLDPTIDHLIPANRRDRGTHSRENVALAHNRCNWERGAGGEVQLRLVG